jgi:hypothetical protein
VEERGEDLAGVHERVVEEEDAVGLAADPHVGVTREGLEPPPEEPGRVPVALPEQRFCARHRLEGRLGRAEEEGGGKAVEGGELGGGERLGRRARLALRDLFPRREKDFGPRAGQRRVPAVLHREEGGELGVPQPEERLAGEEPEVDLPRGAAIREAADAHHLAARVRGERGRASVPPVDEAPRREDEVPLEEAEVAVEPARDLHRQAVRSGQRHDAAPVEAVEDVGEGLLDRLPPVRTPSASARPPRGRSRAGGRRSRRPARRSRGRRWRRRRSGGGSRGPPRPAGRRRGRGRRRRGRRGGRCRPARLPRGRRAGFPALPRTAARRAAARSSARGCSCRCP